MALQDSYNCLLVESIATDVATTDAYTLNIPYTGSGIVVRRITCYDSRLLTTGATANNATATLGVFTAAGGTGVTIVADAALTTHTGSTIVSDRTVAATALTPKVTATTLIFRVGTASGVTSSGISAAVEYSVLP
jgi:hypothetical protein